MELNLKLFFVFVRKNKPKNMELNLKLCFLFWKPKTVNFL
jgi:hypothetical protein